jgi:Zn ribbon nucleic-acid-binding protein
VALLQTAEERKASEQRETLLKTVLSIMSDPAGVNNLDPMPIEEYNGKHIMMDGLPRIIYGYTDNRRLIWSAIYIACFDFIPKKTSITKNNYFAMICKMADWKENDVELFKKLKAGIEQQSNGQELISDIEDKNQKKEDEMSNVDSFVYDNINLHTLETRNVTMTKPDICQDLQIITRDNLISFEYIFKTFMISE